MIDSIYSILFYSIILCMSIRISHCYYAPAQSSIWTIIITHESEAIHTLDCLIRYLLVGLQRKDNILQNSSSVLQQKSANLNFI